MTRQKKQLGELAAPAETRPSDTQFILVYHLNFADYSESIGYEPITARDEEEAIFKAERLINEYGYEDADYCLFRFSDHRSIKSWEFNPCSC